MSRTSDHRVPPAVPDEDSVSNPSGHPPGLLETASLLERELRGVLHGHLVLAALETRKAGESLVWIVALGVVSACLLSTAWLALVGAATLTLVELTSLPLGGVLLMVAAVHGLAAGLMVVAIRRRSRNLLFPASVSRLAPDQRAQPDKEAHS